MVSCFGFGDLKKSFWAKLKTLYKTCVCMVRSEQQITKLFYDLVTQHCKKLEHGHLSVLNVSAEHLKAPACPLEVPQNCKNYDNSLSLSIMYTNIIYPIVRTFLLTSTNGAKSSYYNVQ
jgi:hypothetical protein